jgi:hypothetical protein
LLRSAFSRFTAACTKHMTSARTRTDLHLLPGRPRTQRPSPGIKTSRRLGLL